MFIFLAESTLLRTKDKHIQTFKRIQTLKHSNIQTFKHIQRGNINIVYQMKDITPIVAIPHSPSVYSVALTRGPQWMFTGGEDGMIRKYDFIASVEGKSPLTLSQRHQLVDSVHYGGVICSYWENEVPQSKQAFLSSTKVKTTTTNTGTNTSSSYYEPQLSPVYSLYAQREGHWLLSGLSNGSIALHSVRSQEGSIQWVFQQGHTSTVSALASYNDNQSFLSGGWDRKICEWDLNQGVLSRDYDGMSGQISVLEYYTGQGFMSASIDGRVCLYDIRSIAKNGNGIGQIPLLKGTPPWCMGAAVSHMDGPSDCNVSSNTIVCVGRRNSTVEIWDLRKLTNNCEDQQGGATPLDILKLPPASGPVSSVSIFPPKDNGGNSQYIAVGSQDAVRVWDRNTGKCTILPGHAGGVVSQLAHDENGKFLVCASGNRGWAGKAGEMAFIYEVDGGDAKS